MARPNSKALLLQSRLVAGSWVFPVSSGKGLDEGNRGIARMQTILEELVGGVGGSGGPKAAEAEANLTLGLGGNGGGGGGGGGWA